MNQEPIVTPELLLITGTYEEKLLGVMGDISERYKDLGFLLVFCSKSKIYGYERHYQPSPGEEIVYILPERFRPKLIIFQVIDRPDLLKEHGIDALIIRRQTKKRHFVLALQKILFDIDSTVSAIVLRRELDEIVLSLGGISPKDRSIIQDQRERNRKIVQRALRKHLDLKSYTPENIRPKGIVVSTPAPRKTVPKKQQMSERPKRQRHGGRKKKRLPPSNPGKEILEALIINYRGDLKEMAKNPNINTDVATLRSWIREEDLENFVEEQKN